MVLLLETADVLEQRAHRTRDPGQVPILLRRADHRRREAAQIRERLAAQGAALAATRIARPERTPRRQQTSIPQTARRQVSGT
jgi:hypothetical protein